ncbi:hypothetical protein F4808DRAFT_435988 [Astrocystis sublimbata]|nr:hypothetical protein F4808DRAFT_435988 [Astrocystis sublimbata]
MPPVVIVGNKSDKMADRTVTPKDGAELAERLGCLFVDMSATDYQGVLRVFEELVKEWVGLQSPGGANGCCTIM